MFGKKDTGKFLDNFIARKTRRIIGWALILLGIFLSTPPGFPPDDFLNLFLAQYLAGLDIEPITALVLTYTVAAFTFFALGIYIYPTKDGTIYKKAKRKFLAMLKAYWKRVQNPVVFVASAIMLWLVYNYYIQILTEAGMI